MSKFDFKIGKYGFEIDSDSKKILFYDLGAKGIISEVDSLYDNTIFWLASIGYAIEDLAMASDNLARLTSDSFPDLAIKSRLNTYYEYACMYGRHVDYNNFYAVYLYYGYATSDHRIIKKVAGSITTLGQEAVDLLTGSWYWVLFEIVGSDLKSFRASDPYSDVPSSPQISVTDTDLTNGRWGVRHWGLGSRGLQGLFAVFQQPLSDVKSPLGFFKVQIEGDGSPENPFRPKLPSKKVEIRQVRIIDKRKYLLLKKLLEKYNVSNEDINTIAELFGFISYREYVDKLASTWSAFIPTRKGKPVDSEVVVRIFDVKSDKVIEALRDAGAERISKDDAIKIAKKLDDKLHDLDLVSVKSKDSDEVKKVAKEYVEWRKSQFKVEMNQNIAEMYVRTKKGWE